MSTLNQAEKELIVEYCFGLASATRTLQAEELIAQNRAAADAHAKITATLVPLARAASEPCPAEWADHTVARLCALAARPPEANALSPGSTRLIFRQNLSHVTTAVAVAASILLILGTVIPLSNLIRQRHYRHVCLGQLGRIWKSIDLYSADHDDMLPVVARAAGVPWSGIGSQDPGDYSNTRNLFLLLKHGYIERADDFVCCGRADAKVSRVEPSRLIARRDFAAHSDITYSYWLTPDLRTKKSSVGSRPLMADMNPHFEELSAETSPRLDLRLTESSLGLNSINHGRQGQNILSGDGHVRFSRTRLIGEPADDIYTIRNVRAYRGYEWPSHPNDTFVAP
jgi:hypothetical protein